VTVQMAASVWVCHWALLSNGQTEEAGVASRIGYKRDRKLESCHLGSGLRLLSGLVNSFYMG